MLYFVCLQEFQSPYGTMSPFKGSCRNKEAKRSHKQIQDEELVEKLKEHDYLECYCNALMDPPWGGYSTEEQILREAKQRKKGGSQRKLQTTGTSSYNYLNKDQAAILGESAVLQTTKSILYSRIQNLN